uniref:Thioredoxin 1 (Trx-1) n=1 Tax=Ganoderma boninense TaxID=34458 RepID=A0A5K1JZL0_9APHY|nr:Thioredoxin 1 (Trx-1) [Ganoderma boninense]
MQSANRQVARAGSLILLEVLTVVPNAVLTNQLAQFIPFSIGALFVLSVFNHHVKDSIAVPVPRIPTPLVLSIQPSRAPTPVSIPNGPPPSVVGAEVPRDSSGFQPVEQELVLDSPFVPIHPRRKMHPPSLVPSSAPPRIGDAPVFDAQQKRPILPFQVQYAEQLERRIHTGPIVAPIRIMPQRPQVQVVVEDIEPDERVLKSSSLIGSDIVRLHSARRTTMERSPPSPMNTTPSDYSNTRIWHDTSIALTPTTVRDSTMSMPLSPGPRTAASYRDVLSAGPSQRQSIGRRIRSPAEASVKSSWRPVPVPRTSYSSARTFGVREELPTLREGRPSGSHRTSRMSSFTTTKRIVVSRSHSFKSTRRSSPQPSRMGKALPPIPPPRAPPSATTLRYLAVPDEFRSPVAPDSPLGSSTSIRPSSQYVVASPTSPAYERAQGSGRLRGPRTPPASSTTPSMFSQWPVPPSMSFTGPMDVGSRKWRRRSASCPELPPLDISLTRLRSIDSPRTPI